MYSIMARWTERADVHLLSDGGMWSAHIALDGTHDISCQPFEIYLFAKLWGQYNLKQPFVADLLPRGQCLCDVHGVWL
jgi:hypothetical protein